MVKYAAITQGEESVSVGAIEEVVFKDSVAGMGSVAIFSEEKTRGGVDKGACGDENCCI